MNKSKISIQQAKQLIQVELKRSPPISDGLERWKKILILRTGIIAKSKRGKTTYPYPIGITLENLLAFLENEDNPYKEIKFTGKNASNLLALARVDRHAKDAVHHLIEIILKQNDTLPLPLLNFLNESARPYLTPIVFKRGPHYSQKLFRNFVIAECLELLFFAGYYPMTKNTSDSGDDSACHIMVETLKIFNIRIGYDAIKNIKYEFLIGPHFSK